MRKMKRLPKLHLCCANDEFRSVMCHVLVTKNYVVASDSHVLIEFETSEIFDNDFIDAMPDRFLINSHNWKLISEPHDFIFFRDGKIEVIKQGRSLFIPLVLEENIGTYPDYKKILDGKSPKSIEKIGLKADLLKKISLAIGTHVMHLFFNGEHKSITIKSNVTGVKALIMPVMIHN